MTTRDLAIKIVEEEVGNDICNQIGWRDTIKIMGAIERAIEIGKKEGIRWAKHPKHFKFTDQEMKMFIKANDNTEEEEI